MLASGTAKTRLIRGRAVASVWPMSATPSFLDGQLLVAMPGMGDPRFDRAVVFICSHSAEGAMGLVINKPAKDLDFSSLLKQLDIELGPNPGIDQVYFGGPVEHGRGFVLHSDDYSSEGATMPVPGGFAMTATLEVLQDLARGTGPRAAILTLGYAGWAPGQLESELQANGWLTCEADTDLVFGTEADELWTSTVKRIGIDPRLLSAEGGRA